MIPRTASSHAPELFLVAGQRFLVQLGKGIGIQPGLAQATFQYQERNGTLSFAVLPIKGKAIPSAITMSPECWQRASANRQVMSLGDGLIPVCDPKHYRRPPMGAQGDVPEHDLWTGESFVLEIMLGAVPSIVLGTYLYFEFPSKVYFTIAAVKEANLPGTVCSELGLWKEMLNDGKAKPLSLYPTGHLK